MLSLYQIYPCTTIFFIYSSICPNDRHQTKQKLDYTFRVYKTICGSKERTCRNKILPECKQSPHGDDTTSVP